VLCSLGGSLFDILSMNWRPMKREVTMEIAAKPKVEIVADYEALSRKSLQVFLLEAENAIKSNGVFHVAISGGHTPRRFFELLGEDSSVKALAWDKVQLFWVDERIVPPDSPRSNYKLAVDTFLSEVGVPAENIHRIPTEESDFYNAAHCYEDTVRNVLGVEKKQVPEFDLIVLGMGPDGHTGSLFPNSYAPFDTEDLACVVYCLDEKLNRITLTHPVLRAAHHLIVLVSGQEKAAILKKVLSSEPDEVRYPIHILWPVLDKITWLVDSAAASLL